MLNHLYLLDEIYAAALLQHVRAIDPTVRMKGNIKVRLDEANMKKFKKFKFNFLKNKNCTEPQKLSNFWVIFMSKLSKQDKIIIYQLWHNYQIKTKLKELNPIK